MIILMDKGEFQPIPDPYNTVLTMRTTGTRQ